MYADELVYQIALTLLPGVGDINARKLVSHTGSAAAVFHEKAGSLLRIPGMGQQTVDLILSGRNVVDRAAEELEFIKKHDVNALFFTGSDYPARLRHCIDSPVMLYFIGNANLNAPRIVSIVGTRKATEYGREMCRSLIAGLKELDVLVVSGLAYGIDTRAHKVALDEGLMTVGVLAHGLDRVYPPANEMLARRMLHQGGLLTEFMNGTIPDRENFPKRNRIIAGLADATIVVEAGAKGGALITADIANSYNRDVFAVPGRVGDQFSEGCNNLIKTNRAALVQSAADVMYIMGWDSPPVPAAGIQRNLFVQLSPDEEAVTAILKEYGECSMDKICLSTGIQPSKVAAALLNLEFEGMVKSLPGKIYRLF